MSDVAHGPLVNKFHERFTHVFEGARNVMHFACDNGHVEACKFIVWNYPSLLKKVDHEGRHAGPGHFAVRSVNMDTYLEQKIDLTKCTNLNTNSFKWPVYTVTAKCENTFWTDIPT